jgi:hypothetical protein
LSTVLFETHVPVKRVMGVRERPAPTRRIDDALRRRAFEAVERALSDQPPT